MDDVAQHGGCGGACMCLYTCICLDEAGSADTNTTPTSPQLTRDLFENLKDSCSGAVYHQGDGPALSLWHVSMGHGRRAVCGGDLVGDLVVVACSGRSGVGWGD